MGASTFSGPIRAGDLNNPGYAQMVKSASWTQSTTATDTGIIIPAGSQVLDIILYLTTAPATANLSVGTTSASNELFTGLALGTAANVALFGSTATIPDMDTWVDVGTSDVSIWTDSSAGSTGAGILTVVYAQAIDLA